MTSKKYPYLNNILFGILSGFLVPVVVLYVIYLVNNISVSYIDYIKDLNTNNILTKVISICTLPVLGVFYFYLKMKWYSASKGLIISVFALVFWALYVNVM